MKGVKHEKMHYEIVKTGSTGNCVIINDVMVDVGVPFKAIKDKLYDIKYILLTHIHSDHIRPATLKNIRKMFPRIKIIGNYEVHQLYGVDILANAGFSVALDAYYFEPFECVHDVLTYGYCWQYDGKSIIYATDTASMKNAPKRKYDYFFIESNHDEKKVEMLLHTRNNYGYDAYSGAKRHLSTQDAKAFYYTNRRDKNSVFIELHQSGRFY